MLIYRPFDTGHDDDIDKAQKIFAEIVNRHELVE